GLIALDLNFASVKMHDFLSEVQADTGAGDAVSRSGAVETIEDLRDLVCRYSNPPVADGAVRAGAVHPDLYLHDRAFAGILNGVGEKINDDLFDKDGIAID